MGNILKDVPISILAILTIAAIAILEQFKNNEVIITGGDWSLNSKPTSRLNSLDRKGNDSTEAE